MPHEEPPVLFNARVTVTIYTDTGKKFVREVDVVYKNTSNPHKNKVYHKIMKLAVQKMFEVHDKRPE